jgi:hypothetical protein
MQKAAQLTLIAFVAATSGVAPANAVPGWLIDNPSGTLKPNNIIYLMQLPPDKVSTYAAFGSYMYGSVIRPPLSTIRLNSARGAPPTVGASRTRGFGPTASCAFRAGRAQAACGRL